MDGGEGALCFISRHFPGANDALVIVLWINPCSGKEREPNLAGMEPFTQNMHLLTKQQLPNPAGSLRSPAGEQELTQNGDCLSRECCHFCCHFCCHIRG